MKYNLGSEDAFVVYRLPKEENHYLLKPKDNAPIPFDHLMDGDAAFVIHPFHSTSTSPSLALLPKEIFINPEFSFQSKHVGNLNCITENNYLPLVDEFIDQIKENKFHKAICSRIIEKEMPTDDIFPLFMRLKRQYPFAFVYLMNIPGIGCWMGATPEVLLTDHNGIGETVALAGTRPLSSTEDWGKKDVFEQQMVERYIANILISRKKNFTKTGPFTVNAGRVMHLKTLFQFPLESHWKDVAMQIHPTPAVCGLPKDIAREFILDKEPHDRSYYCGFLGPVHINNQTNLFVNLRCMQVFRDKFALYVGGGITIDSEANKELEETRWKSRTLSDIIEQVYCESEIFG